MIVPDYKKIERAANWMAFVGCLLLVIIAALKHC